MIIQSKIWGVDIVKLQLYDSKKLPGDDRRKYLDVTKDELAEINELYICLVYNMALKDNYWECR